MSTQTRIYAGGAFAFGQQQAVNNFLKAQYSAIVVWSVHVNLDGNLILNNTPFVTNGVYYELETMDLPARLAQLRKAGTTVIFSVGAGGTHDFQNISQWVANGVPGPGNNLYNNFAALKAAMVAAGGDIDAIDFDNEDYLDTPTMVNFGLMLGNIGYASVTFCPYSEYPAQQWSDTYTQLLQARGSGFVSAIHLQCYSGGSYITTPQYWRTMITNAKGNTYLIPGLATNQSAGWWNSDATPPAPSSSVVTTPNVAMYGEADWSNMLRQGNYPNADLAMQTMNGGETFFFFCNGPLDLGPGKQFKTGDAVFFGDKPWWGSAPQCTGYSLSGGCANTYNSGGACPADITSTLAGWKTLIDGGFIWLYDSIVSCVLSDCCGETGDDTATVARAYQQAITAAF